MYIWQALGLKLQYPHRIKVLWLISASLPFALADT